MKVAMGCGLERRALYQLWQGGALSALGDGVKWTWWLRLFWSGGFWQMLVMEFWPSRSFGRVGGCGESGNGVFPGENGIDQIKI